MHTKFFVVFSPLVYKCKRIRWKWHWKLKQIHLAWNGWGMHNAASNNDNITILFVTVWKFQLQLMGGRASEWTSVGQVLDEHLWLSRWHSHDLINRNVKRKWSTD